MSNYKAWIWFAVTIYLPFFICSIVIGAAVGYVAQRFALFLEIHPTDRQNEMVFWAFLAIGVITGFIGSSIALIEFVKSRKKGS